MECMQKYWWTVLKVKVIAVLIWSKYDSFYYICWTADPFPTRLGLMVHYHKPKCLMEKWDCCVKVTEKVQNSSDCSSGQYLINCWTFCNQTQIRPRQYLGASESPHSVQIRPRRHLNAWESPPSVQIRPGRYLGAWQSQNSVQIRPRRYLGTWENPHSVQIIRRR